MRAINPEHASLRSVPETTAFRSNRTAFDGEERSGGDAIYTCNVNRTGDSALAMIAPELTTAQRRSIWVFELDRANTSVKYDHPTHSHMIGARSNPD